MPRRTTHPPRDVRGLAQQKSDFTAEGAPAPGRVGTAVEPEAVVPPAPQAPPTHPSTPPRQGH